MNFNIFIIFSILSLLIIIPSAQAQFSLGGEADQKLIEITIDSTDKVIVKHIIEPSNFPVSVNLVEGIVSEIIVTDENNKEKEFGQVGINNQIVIFPTKESSTIRYNLENAIIYKNGMKSIDIKYEQKISIITPKEIELIYVNHTAILLGDKKGLNCHGCNINLKFYDKNIKKLKQVDWEDEKFPVEFYTKSNISDFIFNQQSKSISFHVENKSEFVTILLPLELLWEPYQVFLDDKKIKVTNLPVYDSYVLLNIKPETDGIVTIIGTTVIPEFPIVAPLAIGFLIIIAIPFMKKINLH